MQSRCARAAALLLLIAGGLAVGQGDPPPRIEVEARFGTVPADGLDALVAGALSPVPVKIGDGPPAISGIKLYRGTLDALAPKLGATPGARIMAVPRIRAASGEPAELAMSQELRVELPMPGLKHDDPLHEVTHTTFTVPMEIGLTAYLAAEDPTALAAVILEARYGVLLGHQGGEGLADPPYPMVAKLGFNTLLDYADPNIDTYLIAWDGDEEATLDVMIFTAHVRQP